MAEWPLLGRDKELSHLAELLDDPAARGVVLSGPQGVGKTRLGLECLRIAAERSCAVERVSATYATSSLPLGAVILSRPAQGTIEPSPAEQAELVHRVAGDLVRQANGRRLVMLIDDVHWLDNLSAVLVHQLAVTGTAFVVLTARTGTTAPDPIVALWKDEVVERISVNAVAPQAIEDLLTHVLGAPVAGSAVAELVDRCEGNMLFLREQVLAASADGSLVLDSGVWRLAGSPAPQPRLVELIEHRLAGLDPAARACVELIAFGEPLDLGDALTIGDEQVIQELEEQGLATVRADAWGGGQVLLAHPVIGEVLRASTSLIRARQVTLMLAQTAEARKPVKPDDLLRIATWRLVCGGGSAELMFAAATAAYARRDYELAIRFAQNALAAGAGFDARLLMEEAVGFTGRHDEAERDLAALDCEVTGPDHRAAIAHARMVQAYLKGDVALGLRVYRDALESIDDPRWRQELTAKRSWFVILQEGPRGGLRATEQIWSPSLEGSPLVGAAVVRACALARAGRAAEAVATARRGAEAHTRLTQPFDLIPAAHDLYVCEALATAGRIEEWDELARSKYAEAIRERSATGQLYFAYQRAKVSLARGQVATAARLAGEAVGIAHQINDMHLGVAALTTLAEALGLQGDVDGAARALAELDSVRAAPWLFTEPALARAWLAIARGDVVSARRILEGDVERALGCDDLRAASLALHSLVRLGAAKTARDPLEQLVGRVEGTLVPAQAQHAQAILSRDGQALTEVGEAFEQMGALLLAAEACCDAAVAFRAAGNPKRAAALSQRACLLLDQCEGARTPASQPLSVRTQLTQAERQTAMLAAQGQSSKDIAALEQVSVRTVESRLQSVYAKLGISSRTELTKSLGGS